MVTPTCPKCRRSIAGDDINVAADVAFCRACNVTHALSALAHGSGIDPTVDLARPPEGAWQRGSGLGTIIGATHKSMSGAFFTFAFAAFWNGIISIFVGLALSSTVVLLGFERPNWLPKPIMNGGPMGVGITLFLWLFLTPFILIGLTMIVAFFSCLGGRTEVRVRDWQTEIFSGVGALGRKRKFRTDLVKDVRIEERVWRGRHGRRRTTRSILVELTEGKPVKFGSGLSDERRQFVAAALRNAVVK